MPEPGDGRSRAAEERSLDEPTGGPVALALEHTDPGSDGIGAFTLTLVIEPGWHIYASSSEGGAPDWTRPLEIDGEGVDIIDLEYPEAGKLPPRPSLPIEDEVRVYQGEIKISGRTRAHPEANHAIRVVFQACDETRCLAAVEKVLEL
jgi:hypothetical protein